MGGGGECVLEVELILAFTQDGVEHFPLSVDPRARPALLCPAGFKGRW